MGAVPRALRRFGMGLSGGTGYRPPRNPAYCRQSGSPKTLEIQDSRTDSPPLTHRPLEILSTSLQVTMKNIEKCAEVIHCKRFCIF